MNSNSQVDSRTLTPSPACLVARRGGQESLPQCTGASSQGLAQLGVCRWEGQGVREREGAGAVCWYRGHPSGRLASLPP